MEKFWLAVFPTLNCFILSHTFILPLKKTNGTLDVEHLLGHMTLLEQTITGFQQTIQRQDADIAVLKANQQSMASHSVDIGILKNEITNLKAYHPIITNQNADIAALKTEISSLKANQQKLDQRISNLENQRQPGQMAVEVTSLKNEVKAAKMKVTLVSNEIISLTLKFRNLTQDSQSLSSDLKNEVNSTKAEVSLVSNQLISLTSKFNNLTQNYQSLASQVKTEVNTTETEVTRVSNEVTSLTSKFNNLTRDCQSLSSKVKHEVNATKTEVTMMSSELLSLTSKLNNLTQECQQLSSQSCLHRLDKNVSEFGNNWNATLTMLSAEIAQLKTEVGFEAWIGSFTHQLQVNYAITVKFDNIQYNIGSGYDSSKGIFTAPVSGTYLLWTQVEKTNGTHLDLNIKRGNEYVGEFYIPTTGRLSGSVVTSVRAQAGDKFNVVVMGAERINCCYSSWFGGTLLYRH